MQYPDVYLKKHEERRIIQGHLWVYSNEIDSSKSPLNTFSPGQIVQIKSQSGNCFGVGYINPHSLISVRFLSRSPNANIDTAFFVKRISSALNLRNHIFTNAYYRLVHAEGDYLPGLVLDLFDDVAVIQTSTLGMELLLDSIVDAVKSVVKPKTILINNASSSRAVEQLPAYEKCVYGSMPDVLNITENNCHFQVASSGAQKTGWFYDHRSNRQALQKYVSNKNVLDVFSYTGGWGIQAAQYGAKHVTCIDSSKQACEWLARNAKLNQCDSLINIICADAFEAMQTLIADHSKFDVVIVDPPAFIKRKKDIPAGTSAYQRLNQLAMQLCSTDGIIVSASCSYHFGLHEHWQCLRKAALKVNKQIQIIEQGHQSPDHPVHPSIPETQYISVITARVMSR